MTARWEVGKKADADEEETPLKEQQINSGAHYIFNSPLSLPFLSVRWTYFGY